MKFPFQLFSPKEDIALSDEEKSYIADMLIYSEALWKVQRKYFFNKINILTRKMVKCSPEELKALQEGINIYQEIISDYEQIKKEYLKRNKMDSKVKPKRDLEYYIQSQDMRDTDGKIINNLSK